MRERRNAAVLDSTMISIIATTSHHHISFSQSLNASKSN